MCFDADALPPHIPQDVLPQLLADTGVASTEVLTLTSADGTQFAAYRAHPTTPSGAGIVILPDVRGLFRFYEELAERFASAGIDAIAFDYFGRTAGVAERGADFEYMPHVMQTKPEQVAADVSAAVAQLRTAGNIRGVFTVGFCFGGANSLLQAANHHGLSGVIGFYGPPTAARLGGTPPIERINEFECPVLGLYGGADQGIPVTEVEKFDQALGAAGVDHEIVVYPGAPHSFFDRTAETYVEESADSWRRILGFITGHTPTAMV
ncbi:MAG: dienelactone hydrolase family protein [Ktedonobacterales bacterium]|nr:dienelactone hydrolase family protein [Ktedonobacterales bacterium]